MIKNLVSVAAESIRLESSDRHAFGTPLNGASFEKINAKNGAANDMRSLSRGQEPCH